MKNAICPIILAVCCCASEVFSAPFNALNAAEAKPQPDQIQSKSRSILILLQLSQAMQLRCEASVPETRIDRARTVISNLVDQLPPDSKIGLRVFGGSTQEAEACKETKMLVPLQGGTGHKVAELVKTLIPIGRASPLGYALNQCLTSDLNEPTPPAEILLMAVEDTCEADPVRIARRYLATETARPKVALTVVSFASKRERLSTEMLRNLAGTFGGKYYDLDSVDKLVQSYSNR